MTDDLTKEIKLQSKHTLNNKKKKTSNIETSIAWFGWLVGFFTSSLTGPKTERAATHETGLGDHDFCLSRSHYTDTGPTSRERAATEGIKPRTSSPGVARSTNWATANIITKMLNIVRDIATLIKCCRNWNTRPMKSTIDQNKFCFCIQQFCKKWTFICFTIKLILYRSSYVSNKLLYNMSITLTIVCSILCYEWYRQLLQNKNTVSKYQLSTFF